MKRILFFALVIALLITSGCGAKPTPVESSIPSESNMSLRSEDDSSYDETSFATNTDGDSLEDLDITEVANDVDDLSADAVTEQITKDVNADAGAGQTTKENVLNVIDESLSTNVKSSDVNFPEAAAIAYLEALRDADIKRMMDAFYIDKFFENHDLASEIDIRKQYSFSALGFPNSNEFILSMNKSNRKKDALGQIVGQYAMLGAYESGLDVPLLYDDNQLYLGDETEIREFTARLEAIFDAPKLDAMKIIGFIAPEKIYDGFSDDANSKKYLQLANMLFADNATGCIVAFEIERNIYLLCLDVVDYGGEWFIYSMDGFIGWEITRFLRLSHNIHGLVPLFAIKTFDGVYNNEIQKLRKTVLQEIVKYEDRKATPATNTDSSAISYVEPGYSSPAEASRAFLEALRDTDLDRIMSACGIAHYAENLDFEAYYMRHLVYNKHNNDARIPIVNDFSKTISLENTKMNRIAELYRLYQLLCYYESGQFWQEDSLYYREPLSIDDSTTETANELVEQLNVIVSALNIDTLNVLGIINIERNSNLMQAIFSDDSKIFDTYFSEMNQENILKQNAHTGADSVGECIACFEINGNIYFLYLSTIEYNGKWYVRSFTGNNFSSLSGMAANMSGLSPVSHAIREYGEEAFGFNEDTLRDAFDS